MDAQPNRILILNELEEKVKQIQPLSDDNKKELLREFEKGQKELDDAKMQYLQLLSLLADTDKEFNSLYQRISADNFAECVDKLYAVGKRVKNNPILKKAFEGMGYRIMEQTRAGRRDDVFHSILRLYMTNQVSFDKELLMAFKQSNDEMFKVLMFSYLSGINE